MMAAQRGSSSPGQCKSQRGIMTNNKVKLVTDQPGTVGYMHGYGLLSKREMPNKKQEAEYDDGYRRGARDRSKDET